MNCPFKNIFQWQCMEEHTVLHEIIDENLLVKSGALSSGNVIYINIIMCIYLIFYFILVKYIGLFEVLFDKHCKLRI